MEMQSDQNLILLDFNRFQNKLSCDCAPTEFYHISISYS